MAVIWLLTSCITSNMYTCLLPRKFYTCKLILIVQDFHQRTHFSISAIVRARAYYTLNVFLNCFLSLFLRQDVSLNLKLTGFAGPAGQWPPRICHLCLSNAESTDTCHPSSQLFTWWWESKLSPSSQLSHLLVPSLVSYVYSCIP